MEKSVLLLLITLGAAISIGMIKNVIVNQVEVRYLALFWALQTPQTILAVGLDWELYQLITKTVIQVLISD
jgi:hypothetical protein